MSLPTPPHTSHRSDKENRLVRAGPRVEWSTTLERCHLLSSPSKATKTRTILVDVPTKSILKKTPLLEALPSAAAVSERKVTPEPSLPQSDSTYLLYPISTIIDPNATLGELSSAYSILGARLRSTADEVDNPESTWPLFQPIRDHSVPLIHSITRDVGRALVDPMELDSVEHSKVLLPSPQKSPRKKKGGMSAQQVKHARDLCSTTHCVLKLLGFLLAQPVVYGLFSDVDLGFLLTEILAIPLKDVLPTLYSRKTCALAIWVLQAQRLPGAVLAPAANRIACAIRRGLDGELGKEGKKGSTNDGLKAIHDLCQYLPEVFVPAFSNILPSLFNNLLAPGIALRLQACYALGGFAFASTLLPSSELHEDIATRLRSFLVSTPTKSSPSKSPAEALILRTLRQTLSNEDAPHPVQGTAWGLSVLAHFVLLLRSTVYEDPAIYRIIQSMFGLVKRSRNANVRILASLAWRGVIWGFFQPRLSLAPVDPNDSGSERTSYFNSLGSFFELGCGVSIIAGLSYHDSPRPFLPFSFNIVEIMLQRPVKCFKDALAVLRQLLNERDDDSDSWFEIQRLLVPSLHSGNYILLTQDISSPDTRQHLQEIAKEGAQIIDIPPLSKDDLTDVKTLGKIFDLLKRAVGEIDKCDDDSISDITKTWKLLLRRYIRAVAEDEDAAVSDTVDIALNALEDIVQGKNMDWKTVAPTSPLRMASSPKPTPRLDMSSKCLRLQVVQSMWQPVRALAVEQLLETGDHFLRALMRFEAHLVGIEEDARVEWATLAARVAVGFSSTDVLQEFWSFKTDPNSVYKEWNWSLSARRTIWKQFVHVWQEVGSSDGIAVLLSIPFSCQHNWEMDDEERKDWEILLNTGVNRALDYGYDAIQFVDGVCEEIGQRFDPTAVSAAPVVDMLLHFLVDYIADARSVPSALAEFVNDTLRSSYPPDSNSTQGCTWMLRSLVDFLPHVPSCLSFDFLEKIQEGLGIWISEDRCRLDEETYGNEISILYQAALGCISQLPSSASTLEIFQPLLEAIFNGREKPTTLIDTFNQFWQEYGASVPEDVWPEQIRIHLGLVESLSQERPQTPTSEVIPSQPEISEVNEGCTSPYVLITPPSSPMSIPALPRRSPHSMMSLRSPRSPTFGSRLVSVHDLASPLSKKRRVQSDDKENISPLARPEPPRKRVQSDDHYDGPITKKAKADDERRISPPKVVDDIFSESLSASKRTRKRKLRDLSDDPADEYSEDEGYCLPSFVTLLQRNRSHVSKKRRSSSFGKRAGVSQTSSDDHPSSDQLSSDDDPHVGQVTPSHLISPEVRSQRRELRLDSDPPSSDDSLLSSPTKRVVKKKSGYTSLNGPYWAGTI